MKKIKVGIIGCGTIGAALAKAIRRDFKDHARLEFLCDRRRDKAETLRSSLSRSARVVSAADLIRRSDLIVEAASAAVSAGIARAALRLNKEVLIMSVGGLLDDPQILKLALNGKGKLWVPSGAIAGVDGLIAAKEAGLRSVKLITRKPPEGLNRAPYFQKKKFPALSGKKEVCVFRGNASQAMQGFPQNINVGAILSLAGVGAKKTKIEIWTSRAYKANRHEITIEGKSGKIHTVAENVPSPENPKTSALAYYSAIAVLRKIFSGVQIG